MSTITIRNIDDEVKKLLRLSAAAKNISMEEEIRRILKIYLLGQKCRDGLGTSISNRFKRAGNVDLPVVERTRPRELKLPENGKQ